MDTYFSEIWFYFGPRSRLVKPRLKICTLAKFLRIKFKVELDTHLRDNHGHLFLWDLDLFGSLFKLSQTKVQNIYFCLLSQNWVLKVDLGTHFRDKHGHLFFLDLELFWHSFKVGQTKVENMHVYRPSWNWFLR